MKSLKQLIAVVLLVSFTFSNISFAAEINHFKLATPSNFSGMKGAEFKDATQIQAGILQHLKSIDTFSADSLKSLGTKEFTENSVFGKRVQASIHFGEAREFSVEGSKIYTDSGHYIFRASTKAGADYYCLVSQNKGGAGYRISVVPERLISAALEKGIVKFTHESVNSKDKEIIGLYLAHEITTKNNAAIDEWIRKKMIAGEYVVDDNVAKNNPLYRNTKFTASFQKIYAKEVDGLMKRLRGFGATVQNTEKIQEALLSKPLVFIPYDRGDIEPGLPILIDRETGEKVFVHAHSSPFATYIFIPTERFLENWSGSKEVLINEYLMHEIGAICGLRAKVYKHPHGNRYNEYKNALDYAVYARTPAEATAILKEAGVKIESLAPVDLFNLELRNDYAAGVTGISAESRFKRWMGLIAAAFLGASATPSITTGAEAQAPLADKGSSREIGQLIKALKDKNSTIRESAATALKGKGLFTIELEVAKFVADMKDDDYSIRESAFRSILKAGPPALPAMIAALKDPDPRIRSSIIVFIGSLKAEAKSAVGILIKEMKNTDSDVRYSAANALANIGVEAREAIPSLIRGLKDPNNSVRGSSAHALGVIRIPTDDVLSALEKALQDPDNLVQFQARHAIDAIRNEAKRRQEVQVMKPAMGRMQTTEEVKELIRRLMDRDWRVCEKAAEEIEKIGPAAKDAVPYLIKKLEDNTLEGGHVRFSVTRALGSIGPAAVDALPALVESLKMHNLSYTEDAIEKVGAGSKESVPLLIKMLEDPVYGSLQRAAVMTLGNVGPAAKDAVPYLVKKLKGTDSMFRSLVLYTIGDIGPAAEDAIPDLIIELRTSAFVDVISAVEVLSDIGPAAKDTIPLIMKTISNKYTRLEYLEYQSMWDGIIVGSVVKMGPDAMPYLMKALKDPDWCVRRNAVTAIGKFGPAAKDAVPALVEMIFNDNAQAVSLQAAFALTELGSTAKEALPDLKKFMSSETTGKWMVKGAVPTTISHIEIALERERSSPEAGLKKELPAKIAKKNDALSVIVSNFIAPRNMTELVKDLRSDDWRRRRIAAEDLGLTGPAAKDAIPDLIQALKDDNRDVRKSVLVAIGEMGPSAKSAIPILIGLLSDPSWRGEERIAQALAGIGPQGIPYIVKELKNPSDHVRENVAEAIKKMGPAAKDAIPDLIEALKDHDWTVRITAAESLGKIGPAAKDAGPALVQLYGAALDNTMRRAVKEATANVDTRRIRELDAIDTQRQNTNTRPLGLERTMAAEAEIRAQATLVDEKLEKYIRGLLDKMNNPDKERCRIAIGMLSHSVVLGNVNLGPLAKDVVSVLAKLSKHADNMVRIDAIALLGEIGSAAKDAVPALTEVITNSDFYDARNYAIVAIGKIGPNAKSAVPALIGFLKLGADKEAMIALGRIGAAAKDAIPELAKISKEHYMEEHREIAKEIIEIIQKAQKKEKETTPAKPQSSIPMIPAGRLITAAADDMTPLIDLRFITKKPRMDHYDREMGLQLLENKLLRFPGKYKLTKEETLAATDFLIAITDCKEYMQQRLAKALLIAIGEPVVMPLIESIKWDQSDGAEYRVEALGKIGDKRAVAPLMEFLNSTNGAVIIEAALALEKLDGDKAIDRLIKIMFSNRFSEIERVHRAVAGVLGRLGAEKAIEPLNSLLNKEQDKSVIYSIEEAIEKIKKAQQERKKGSMLPMPAGRLITAGAEDQAPLSAADTSKTIKELINKLEDPDQKVREKAAEAIGSLGPVAKSAVPYLIKRLYDTDLYVHREAIIALGKVGPAAKDAVSHLLKISEDIVDSAKKQGFWNRRITSFTYHVKSSKGYGTDAYAIEAIGNIGPDAKDAIPYLIKWLEGYSEPSRGVLPQDPDMTTAAYFGQIAVASLVKMGNIAIPMLGEALRNPDFNIRWGAVAALSGLGEAAIPRLTQGLKDSDKLIRKYTAEFLKKIGPAAKYAVADLANALNDPDADVRRCSADALGKMGAAAKNALPALNKAYKETPDDGMGGVRDSLREAISKIKYSVETQEKEHPNAPTQPVKPQSSVQPIPAGRLITAGADDQAPLSERAIDVRLRKKIDLLLKRMVSTSLPSPNFFYSDEEEYRNAAANKLANIGAPVMGPLLELAKYQIGRNSQEYEYALKGMKNVIEKINDPRIIPYLVKMLDDQDARDNVRNVAVAKLDSLNWRPATQREQLSYLFAKKDWDGIIRIGRPAVGRLLRILGQRDYSHSYIPDDVISAINALGEIKDSQAITQLINLLAFKEGKITAKVPVPGAGPFNHGGVIFQEVPNRHSEVMAAARRALVKIGSPAIEPLQNAFKDPNPSIRRNAAMVLEEIRKAIQEPKKSSALPIPAGRLITAGVEDQAEIRKGNISGRVKEAIKNLEDPRDSVRMEAALVLSAIGPAAQEAIPSLIKTLKDPKKDIRTSAVIALGEIGQVAKYAIPEIIKALEDPERFERSEVVQAIGKMGPAAKDATPVLLKILANEREYIRFEILTAIEKIGPAAKEAISTLAKILENNEDPAEQEMALKALGGIGHAAVPILIKALKSSSSDVRCSAVAELGEIRPVAKNAIPSLIKALDDSNRDVRVASAGALGSMRQAAKDAIPVLIKKLKDPNNDKYSREYAAKAIGDIGVETEDILKSLEEMSEDPDQDISNAAKEAIYKIKKSEQDRKKSSALPVPTGRLITAGAEDQAPIVDMETAKRVQELIKKLKDHKEDVRKQAAEDLGEIGSAAKDAVPGLIEALMHLRESSATTSVDVRIAAVKALGKIGPVTKDVIPALSEAISKDCSGDVVGFAAQAIGNIGPAAKNAVPALINILYSRINGGYTSWPKEYAVTALGRVGSAAVPALINEFKKEGVLVSVYVSEALGNIGPAAKDAVPYLLEELKKSDSTVDYSHAFYAAEALSEIGLAGKDAIPVLIRSLKDPMYSNACEFVHRRAARALGRIGPITKDVIPALIPLLSSDKWEIHDPAVEVLGDIGPKAIEALPALENAAKNTQGKYNNTDLARIKLAIGKIRNSTGADDQAPATPNMKAGEAEVLRLIQVLNDKDESWEARAKAATTLGKIGGEKAFQALVKIQKIGILQVKDRNDYAEIYMPATVALGQMHDRRAIPYLLERLPVEEFRIEYKISAIAEALGEIGDKNSAVSLLPYVGRYVPGDTVIHALIKLGGSELTKSIMEKLKTEKSADARNSMVEVLRGLKDRQAVPLLTGLLNNKSEDWNVRRTAARALGNAGGEEAYQSLIKAHNTRTGNRDVDYHVVIALGELGDKRAVPDLITRLKTPEYMDELKRSLVADALVNIGPEAIPELKEALNNSTKEIIGAIRNIIQRIEKAQEQKKGTPATEPKRSSALETGPGMAAQPVDEASQILWDVATGAISKENAKARLSEALPVLDVPHHQRDAAYDALIAQASVVTAALGVRRNSRYASPSRDEILAVATKIKEAGIEVFVPKSQFPGDTAGKYRRAIEAVGGKLRAYQKIEDLQNLVKNPAKSIVMTSGMTGDDLALVEALKAGNSKLRFMSFEKVEELESMGVDELDNYQADILGILLVARVITPEDCLDQGNPTYRLLLHLLEDYMPDGVSVENYVNDIVTNASRFIKTILKALPITAYKTMRQSMEVLWSA